MFGPDWDAGCPACTQYTSELTDALLARHYPSVSRRVVKNPGARVSARGFASVVAQAASDPDLAVETGIRVDLPSELRHRLLRDATEAVRARLLSKAPTHLFEEIRDVIATVSAGVEREMAVPRDFTSAKTFVAKLKEAGKLDKIRIIGFDEDPITLGGVKEGSIVGTVVQQPFEWGYQGMKLMAKYIEGDKSGIPGNGIIIVPGKVIDKSNVDDFMGQMKQMLKK